MDTIGRDVHDLMQTQVEKSILAKIDSNERPAGSGIPSERDLMIKVA
jgi:DNA-binding GntR family transcriptional regulator